MRTVLIAGVAVALTGAAVAPASADALGDVDAACRSAHEALVGSGGSVTTPTRTLLLSADGFETRGPAGNRIVLNAVGTYGAVADDGLRGKERSAAFGYLGRPATQWWLNADSYATPALGWAATYDQARDDSVRLVPMCAEELSAAVQVTGAGGQWSLILPGGEQVVVTADGQGRLVTFGDVSVSYGTAQVTAPATSVGYAAWRRASQAASLNSTLREVGRGVARGVNAGTPTIAAIDAATRAAIPADRAVPLKVRQLRRGVLIYARNPFTKTYHAWRVYLKAGDAVARRVAP